MLENIQRQYAQATKRLFLIDYDGTLVNFEPTPEEALVSPEALHALKWLANDDKNTVVILSGRDNKSLGSWLSPVPVFLAAEYGAIIKRPGGHWHEISPVEDEWKHPVRSLLQEYDVEIPGSFTEEKIYALVWHYRQADPVDAASGHKRLRHALKPLVKKYGLELLPGDKVLEVRRASVNKGTTAAGWLRQNNWDFILSAGDDISDEVMFEVMPPEAYTIKVGRNATIARDRLSSPRRMIGLLKDLVSTDQQEQP